MDAKQDWKFGDELQRIECGVDYGNLVGYFVRLSVRRDDGQIEWLSLAPEEAEELSRKLAGLAQKARREQQRSKS